MSHFRGLSAALGYPHCPNQIRLVRRFALSQFKSAMQSGKLTPTEEFLASKNSWKNAVLADECIVDVSESKNMWQLFALSKQTMPNERDINAINSFKRQSACSLQLLRGAITVIRYGPNIKNLF